jgi:putative phosphoribosyl transferase
MITESPRPDAALRIRAGRAQLPAQMHLPRSARGLVILADGVGAGVARAEYGVLGRKLRAAALATLSLDLLDVDEAHDRHNVCDVELQAARLLEVARWLATHRDTASLPLGYFGTGAGAGAALLAAAHEPERVRAVVCGGGRPDVALYWLPRVKAPTLLIVSERDMRIVEWNADAYVSLHSDAKRLVVVPHPGPDDEETPAVESTASYASEWFRRYLPAAAGAPVRHRISRARGD